jgi:16S rRNA (uracil1498-N3)-methyltransferase
LIARPGSLAEGQVVKLDSTEAAHLSGALRGRVGDRIVLIDGAGCVADARVTRTDKRAVVAEVSAVEQLPKGSGFGFVLALAVIERQPMDWAVQKAVEVGVGRFVPIISARTQRTAAAAVKRGEHWRRLALQALKQCRRPWAMAIDEPSTLEDFLRAEDAPTGVFGDPSGPPLGVCLESGPECLVVGPEGGFTPDEAERLRDRGWTGVSFGRHVLRAETAAVVGAAMLVASRDGLV